MVATTKVVGWGEAVQCLEQFYNLTAAYSLLVKGAAQLLLESCAANSGGREGGNKAARGGSRLYGSNSRAHMP